jgi:hypothetical protein
MLKDEKKKLKRFKKKKRNDGRWDLKNENGKKRPPTLMGHL